jgi:hypothetical protein
MSYTLLAGVRRRTRNVAVAGLSLVLVLGIGSFLLSPSSTSFAATVHRVGVNPGHDPSIYGKVTGSSGPIANVSVCAKSQKHGPPTTACTFTTSAGTYFLGFAGPAGQWRMTFKVGNIQGHVTVTISNGEILRVDAVQVSKHRFVPFPVSSY